MRLPAVLLAALLLVSSPGTTAIGEETTPMATTVTDFLLVSAAGERVHLADPASAARATVVAFLALGDSMSQCYAPRLAELAEEYEGEGIRFLGVDPAPADTAEKVRAFCTQHGIEFHVLLDPLQAVQEQLGVRRGAEVLLIDHELVIQYRGAVDDQFTIEQSREYPREEYLVQAIESLLAGEDVPVSRTDAPGKKLIASVAETPWEHIDFNRNVAPILYENCVECHRPGQIGPMELIDYDEVRGWAPMIAEVVLEERMPPWHADPRFGDFENARRLTETEKAVLVQWADSGAPRGDAEAEPAPPVMNDEGWLIGEPDLILEIPREEKIPAEGVVDYRYVLVDPKITEDRFAQAVEIRPTNTEVTHHVLALMVPPGMTANEVLRDPNLALGAGHFGVNVPGGPPAVFPEGYGQRVAAGTRFLLQLHYTPNGELATDRSRMGIRWSRVPVIHEVHSRAVLNFAIDIPPGEPAATFHADHKFTRDTRLLALFPHMHSRGKAFRIDLVREDEVTTLLSVPNYDFNWQHTYYFRTPPTLNRGDSLKLTATYDNSAENPFNPDPSKRVRWGDQTWEEMLVGYITYVESVPGPDTESAESGTPGSR